MEFTELIAKRQSIRRYKPGDIPVSDIEKMVDAARVAPSGKNLQAWHFIAIKNREMINAVGDAILEENERICRITDAKDKNRADKFRAFVRNFTLFFLKAPLLFVVMAKQYEPSGYFEMEFAGLDNAWLVWEKNPGMQGLGAAIEHLTLRAIELGYGSCWITSANYADEGITALMREKVGFDEPGYFMSALVSVGIPEENPKSPPKKALSEILTIVE
ncbi:MAG: nitroreductase family protein [Clostridiales Family XIII bacterium]|jgi:nitroreductase|nr:nitroreductase family protein [Clostridiales Family XIII bacterium]